MSPDEPVLSRATVWPGIAVAGLAAPTAVTTTDWKSAPMSRTGSLSEPPASDLTTMFNGGVSIGIWFNVPLATIGSTRNRGEDRAGLAGVGSDREGLGGSGRSGQR